MSITVGDAKTQLRRIEATLADEASLHAKVAASFAALDVNKNGTLDAIEAMALIRDLCGIMALPQPEPAAFAAHYKMIDASRDSKLDVREVGGAIVGALLYKAESIKHFMSFAERDKLGDDAVLPHE